MGVDFKLADASDGDLLAEFMREFYAVERAAWDERGARSALKQILTDDSLGRVWLIRADGAPAGYVAVTFGFSLEYHGRDAFIDEIYIRARHRGRGAGRMAMEFVEDACRALGVRALHLEVGRENARARGLYRKAGFEEQESCLMTKRVAV